MISETYNNTHKWDDSRYCRITNVVFEYPDYIIYFANGDVVRLPLNQCGLEPGVTITPELFKFTNGCLTLRQPYDFGKGGPLQIPWDKIRYLTDPEFKQFTDSYAADSYKKLGARMLYLRMARGLMLKELAIKSGVYIKHLDQIETGEYRAKFSQLRTILHAMGYSMKDLAGDDY